eukprot:403377440
MQPYFPPIQPPQTYGTPAFLKPQISRKRSLNGKGKFECPHCQRRCQSQHAMDNHIRVHTGDKPFCCLVPECDKTFKQKSQQYSHMRNSHGYNTDLLKTVQPGRASDSVIGQVNLSGAALNHTSNQNAYLNPTNSLMGNPGLMSNNGPYQMGVPQQTQSALYPQLNVGFAHQYQNQQIGLNLNNGFKEEEQKQQQFNVILQDPLQNQALIAQSFNLGLDPQKVLKDEQFLASQQRLFQQQYNQYKPPPQIQSQGKNDETSNTVSKVFSEIKKRTKGKYLRQTQGEDILQSEGEHEDDGLIYDEQSASNNIYNQLPIFQDYQDKKYSQNPNQLHDSNQSQQNFTANVPFIHTYDNSQNQMVQLDIQHHQPTFDNRNGGLIKIDQLMDKTLLKTQNQLDFDIAIDKAISREVPANQLSKEEIQEKLFYPDDLISQYQEQIQQLQELYNEAAQAQGNVSNSQNGRKSIGYLDFNYYRNIQSVNNIQFPYII